MREGRPRKTGQRCALAALVALGLLQASATARAAEATAAQDDGNAIRPTISRTTVTMEAALAIAQDALAAGKKKGCAIAVSVVDRAGIPLLMLRADGGTEQFVTGAQRKAWTSVNLRDSTRSLAEQAKSGKEDFAQLPHVENALLLMGGVPLEDGAGTIVGAVGVAGCPSGLDDDACARVAADSFARLLKKP